MKKIRGGYQIALKMGYVPMETAKISNFLNLIDAPMERTEKGMMAYSLTEQHIKFLKKSLKEIKKGLIRWKLLKNSFVG